MDRINPRVGRTHRMMEEALKALRAGNTVTVIGLYNTGRDHLTEVARSLGATEAEITAMCITKYRGHWDLEALLGHEGEEYLFFVDHTVLEEQYKYVLKMLHKFDN